MKKVMMAVLFLAVIAAGVYFFFFNKKENSSGTEIKKELVIGKWKIDTLVAQKDSSKDGLVLLFFAMDTNARKQVYDFQKNGEVFISLPGDTLAKPDTSSFSWGKANELLWKQDTRDSAAEAMTVLKLNKDSLVVQSKDSTLIYLKKAG